MADQLDLEPASQAAADDELQEADAARALALRKAGQVLIEQADQTSDCGLLRAGRALVEQSRNPPCDDAEEFDWRGDDSIVLREQPATAIYFNQRGCLVIRQERSWDQNDDIFITISPENAQTFLDKLCDVLGIPSVP
jgi:hypothetical protein